MTDDIDPADAPSELQLELEKLRERNAQEVRDQKLYRLLFQIWRTLLHILEDTQSHAPSPAWRAMVREYFGLKSLEGLDLAMRPLSDPVSHSEE